MTTNKSSKLVPRLRFSEFRDAGDWKRDQIGNIASITKGKGVSKADITNSGAIPCIRYAELYTHYCEVIHDVVSHTNVPHEDLILSQSGDVIVPASGETRVDIARAACVLPEHVALGSDLNILRSELYGPFFSYLLNSPLRRTISRMAQGDTVAHLYPNQLSQVWLAYPLRLEQQKIADCLGSLDDLIAAEGRKLEALRQHKKGLMQQLFPQPGETVPRLRFKDDQGEDYPDWNTKFLGDLYDITSSKRVFQSEWKGSGIPFYRAREIIELSKYGTVNNDLFISPEMYEKYSRKYGAPQENDLLVTGVGTIGKLYVVPMNRKIYFKDGNIVWFKNLNRVSSIFVKYLFGTRYVEKQLVDNASITTVATYTIEAAKKTRVLIPVVKKQQKIADCLGSLDDLIAAEGRKIEALRQHKKGLMQQLFPSPD